MEDKTGLSTNAYFFVFGFIFLYIALTYLGADMTLAAIASGFVIIGFFGFFNWESIKEAFVLKPKPKKADEKLIEGEIVQKQGELNDFKQ